MQLCWVLEPERLAPVVIGEVWPEKGWPAFESKMDRSHVKRMKELRKLASFFLLELELLKCCCVGRSYNCIYQFEKHISYPMLISLCSNEELPRVVRATAFDLVTYL